VSLLVASCSYDAAKFAVLNWHYSQSMPPPRRVLLGVWEAEQFKGCVIFSRGASASLGTAYGLGPAHVCELTRVALREHEAPVSAIVSRALSELKRSAPGLRLVISFADPAHGHHGGIYQAGNWTYLGTSAPQTCFVVNGELRHSRSMGGVQFGSGRNTRQSLSYLREHIDPGASQVVLPGKHRYGMPLDKSMRRLLAKKALPYPERAGEASSVTRSTSGGERQVRPRPPAPRHRPRVRLV